MKAFACQRTRNSHTYRFDEGVVGRLANEFFDFRARQTVGASCEFGDVHLVGYRPIGQEGLKQLVTGGGVGRADVDLCVKPARS